MPSGRHDKRQHGLEPACIGFRDKRAAPTKSQKILPKSSKSRPPTPKCKPFPFRAGSRGLGVLPATSIYLKIIIFVA